ncbi:MAG TPA: VOC family protein [Bryobacteraceae bacterium]|nr:VOC family protein [Bryobacteraceae bacterium]
MPLHAYPIVQDVPGFVAFLKSVFGPSHPLKEKELAVGSAGGYHGEVQIGDSLLMMGGGGAKVSWKGASAPMAFHIYVPDVDAAYARAIGARAKSLQAPKDQEWGERTANVKDPFGNNWYIATFRGATYHSEGAPTIQPYLQPVKSEPVIDFIVKAFDAEETGRAEMNGAILHTTVKIAGGAIELADATEEYPPMPGTFYLYVPNVDASYKQALEAGGTSIYPPTDHDYGDRGAGVKDAFGDTWYLGTPIAAPAAS